MKKSVRVVWAALTFVIAMVINLQPASAQQRTWRRDGAAAAPAAGQCVSVDQAVSTLEALCKDPANAGCPRCAQYRPCMGSCGTTGPSATTATPGPATQYAYSQQCEDNQPAVAGAHMDSGKCICADHYKPLTVMTKGGYSGSPNVKAYVLVKRCVPTDRSETEIAAINAQIQKLVEIDARLAQIIQANSDRIDAVEKDVAVLKGQIGEARALAITANVRIDQLVGKVSSIESGLVALDQQLAKVQAGATKLSVSAGFGMMSRGNAGTLYQGLGTVGFHATVPDTRLILWADARFGYGSAGGVNLDGSKGSLWTGGGAAGFGSTFDDAGRIQGRLGFRATQVFVTEGSGEHFRGYSLGGVGQIRYDIPSSPIFVMGEFGVGGGQVGYFGGERPESRAHTESPVQLDGSVNLGFSTNIF